MDKAIYRRNAYAMLYLTKCAILGRIPDKNKLAKIDLQTLFKVCQSHILTACVAYALESAGIHDDAFTQAKNKAIRKNILFDAERKKILNQLEQEHIWYMPMKGAILKDWYPKLGMRQMSDNDILIDANHRKRIKDIMLDMGFTCERFGKGNVDEYFKPPVCNFEMHAALFTPIHIGDLYKYYDNVKARLIKDEDNGYGYHFRIEDFYVYLIAHEYKHFARGGIGVRSLVDIYVFMSKFGDSLDWDYLKTELAKLEIVEYERESRTLAMKLFRGEKLTVQEKKMLDYYIFSGTYGTFENRVQNRMNELSGGSKPKYIFMRIFPPMDEIERHWNFVYRHKWLIPLLWIYRPFHGLFINRQKLKTELKYLLRRGKTKQ